MRGSCMIGRLEKRKGAYFDIDIEVADHGAR
jgi:hypothetical protein